MILHDLFPIPSASGKRIQIFLAISIISSAEHTLMAASPVVDLTMESVFKINIVFSILPSGQSWEIVSFSLGWH